MEITEKSNTLVELSTDSEHILHRKGAQSYLEVRRATISRDAVDDWEEIPLAEVPAYTEAEYGARVEELIRERYSVADEFALINNIMAGVTEKRQSEYAAYQEYREECKRRAKEMLLVEHEAEMCMDPGKADPTGI